MNGHAFKLARWFALFAVCSIFLLLSTSLQAATFVVNSTADSIDVNPGDGVCRDAQGRCTLRAAIMESDALPSWDVIDLSKINDPSQPIILTITGADETYAATGGDPPWIVTGTPDPSRGDLDITSSLTIQGAGPDKTIIEWPADVKSNPPSGDRIFHIQKTNADITVSISGLTVRNGVTPSPVSLSVTPEGLVWTFKRKGAGIAIGPGSYMELVDPNKQHGQCSGEGGHGGMGGGEDEDCGGESGLQVTLTNVYLLDNQSGSDGGGLYNTAPLVLGDSVISGNTAKSKGGGLYNGSDLTMYGTLVGTMAPEFPNPNSAKNGGGMFDGAFHESHISGSSFISNLGGNGGGIAGRRRVLMYLSNTTISNNSASEAGGGISTNGQVIMQNNTIADNVVTKPESGSSGAGINVFAMGTYSFVNTLFSRNTLQDASGPIVSCGCSGEGACTETTLKSAGHNLADDATCYFDSAKGDLPDTSVQLGPLAYNDGPTPMLALLSGSPAVDAGDNSQCPNNDQRGGMRPASGTMNGVGVCDIGAFELFVHTADLHIEDVIAPDHAYTGDPVTIDIRMHNDPSATAAATGVTLSTDPIPDRFSVNSIAVISPGDTGTCTEENAVVNCTIGDLGIGSTADVILTGTLKTQGPFALTAHVANTTPIDPLTENNSDHVNIAAIGHSHLAISTSSGGINGYVQKDTSIPFTIHNDGPDAATNLRLLITFPDSLHYKSITFGDACTYSVDDTSVLCLLGDLEAGGDLSGSLTLEAQSVGSTEIAFSLDADQHDTQQLTIQNATLKTVNLNLKTTNGSGGCVFNPDSEFDPTLLAILILGSLFLSKRRISKG